MRKIFTLKRSSEWLLFLLCAWLLAMPSHAQTYLISGGNVTTCAGTIYDSGGASGNYGNNANQTATLTPATAGTKIRLIFSSLGTESCCDALRIYDGASTAATLIGTYAGTTSPGTITATNAAGQLTLVFTSDGSVTGTGFAAAISCFNPAAPVPTITSFTPTSGSATTSVVITGTNFTGVTSVLFNGTPSATFNVNSATQITAIVPSGTSTGPISVTTSGGTATSSTNFDTGIYLMSNAPITTCSGTLYDSGGASGSYADNESFTKTITPATAGAYVRLAFASLGTESCCDALRIYDGASTAATLIGTYAGTTSPGTITATNAAGQLTLVFTSDGSVTDTGFEAAISCVTAVPAITSFTPTSGPVGTSVVITGTNFTGTTAVSFNNVAAPGFVVNSATQITATVPSGAATGRIRVTSNGTTAVSATDFTVPAPAITSFTPTSGLPGTSVVITGTGLAGATAVSFNNVAAPGFVVNSATQITVSVPTGASTGAIRVTTPAGTGVSGTSFTVPPPTITSFTPTSGAAGTSVVITGTNFTGATAVNFNGVAAPGFVVNSDTQITVSVPTNASTGPINVTNSGVTVASTGIFSTGLYTMDNQAVTTCAGTFTDSGGPAANYGNSQDFTKTFSPGTAGSFLQFTFSAAFALETCCDYLRIYDGASTSATLIGEYRATSPGTITATNATGQLTFVFHSDGSVTDTGWSASIACVSTVPTITSFTPTSGLPGTSVVITGTNLTGATAVSFNNVAAPGFVVNSATQITVNVPMGATTGRIRVTNNGTVAVSATDFTVPAPAITSFTPTSGPAGTSVVITGSGFTGATAVAFFGTAAPGFVVNSATQITVSVPAGAYTGPLSVTTPAGVATSTASFDTGNTAYLIGTAAITTCSSTLFDSGGPSANYSDSENLTTTLTPATAGAKVQLVFSSTFVLETCCDYLRIYDGADATATLIGEYRATSPGTITATNATGQLTLVFHSDGSVNYSGFSAAISCVSNTPGITSFTPTNGLPGTSVVITGTNFTGATAVSFNNIAAASFTVNSATQITATVPTGATTGRIRVTTPVATAISATDFTVPAPAITSFTPTSGPAGTSVVITGSGFTGATAVAFFGTAAPGFVVNSATQITVSVPAGAYTGPLSVTTPAGAATSTASFDTGNTAYLIGTAAITTCSGTLFDSGGTSANYSNNENLTTTLTPATPGAKVQLVFASLATESCCDALRIYDGANTSATLIGTYGGTTNPGTITATNATGQLTLVFTSDGSVVGAGFQAAISCATPPADLTVPSGQSLTATGTYNNITVQSGGTLTLTGATSAAGAVQVQGGGILITNCQTLNGTGSFALQTGAELRICDPAGIVTTGANGAIQVTGTRTYAADASYTYNGTAAQVTGAGLPATVRNLTVNNPTGLTLSQAVSIAEVARLQSGNLATGGFGFTLLSSAAGTALVDNSGGSVTGTGTMQRAVTNAVAGPAYRHFSSPVLSTTLADLTTTGFAPTFNPSYNSVANPSLVTPFPTVFGYDQARIATVTSTYGAFDKGWYSPAGTGDVMQPTRGYTVNAPATATPIDFVGTFNNAAQNSGTLSRGTDAQAGWQLLGNPYPSPLDWNTVTPAQRPGMDGAMYVYQSTGQYAGTYRSFDNGIGASPLIDAGSGYFARVSAPGGSGAVNLTNANRVTTFGAQPAFGRGNDTRPQLHLTLTGAGSTDEAFLYLQAGATAAIEPEFDAIKLANPTGLDLASLSGTEALAINGLAPLTRTDVVVPLLVRAPRAGSFSFEISDLANFGATTVYLRDALTGTQQPLAVGTRYTFSLATATAGAGRFSVVFRPANVTATRAEFDAAAVSLYPNPVHGSFTVLLPPLAGQREVRATLLNALGQAVLTRTIGLTAAGATAEFNTQALATGVYTLRLQAENQALTKRVVIE